MIGARRGTQDPSRLTKVRDIGSPITMEVVTLTVLLGVVILIIIWILRPAKKHPFITKDSQSRPLSDFEKMTYDMSEKGNLLLSNVIHIRSKKRLTVDVVRMALEPLVVRHPLLRMSMQVMDGDTDNIWFIPSEDITESLPLLESGRTDWKNVMEENLLTPYDVRKGPLWRVTFLQNATYTSRVMSDESDFDAYPHQSACVFGFHHCIIDGIAYMHMFDEFLDQLHHVLSTGERLPVDPFPLLPPCAAYIPELVCPGVIFRILSNLATFASKFKFIVRKMEDMLTSSNAFTEKYADWISQKCEMERKTKIHPVEFSKEATKQLLQVCKRNGATIQGAVQTACISALRQFLLDNESDPFPVTTNIPVNIRSFLPGQPIPVDYVGTCFAALILNQTIPPIANPSEFWNVAKSITEDIRKEANLHSVTKFLVGVSVCSNIFKATDIEYVKKRNGGRGALLTYTNLGNCSFLNRDDSSLVKMRARYGCSAEQNSGPVTTNNLATFEGRLFWTFVYYPHVMSEEWMKNYADIVQENLQKACQESSSK